ncbi:Caspase Dronc [Gryllus bimaculatus]|nr:Caspase Dronc [Gryllus bimaculatus]
MSVVGMEEDDRRNITRNMGRLVDETNIDVLIPKLLEKGVFSSTMIEKYLPNAGLNVQQRKTALYLDIQRRGPLAFGKLIASLIETKHYSLAILLRPDVSIEAYSNRQESVSRDALPGGNHHSGTTLSNLPEYYSEQFHNQIGELHRAHPNARINLNVEPLRVQVKYATFRSDQQSSKPNLTVYPMGSRPKGYFLLINNIKFINNIHEERFGAHVDDLNLTILFQELGYEVIPHRNLKLSDMKTKIEEFAQMEEHKRAHSCVVAILSHGFSGDEPGSTDFAATDGLKLSSSWVLECFNNYNCPNLMRRPKIFIFQTCRGDKADFGVMPLQRQMLRPRVVSDGFSTAQSRTYTDMLLAYSTLPGYVSNRDMYCGTWYIQSLCEIFMEHACDTEIQEMLMMVDSKLKHLIADNGTMQTSSFENWGFQKFFFNPGLYDDSNNMDSAAVLE